MNKTVCVFCSSSNKIDTIYFKESEKFGRLLAENNCSLIYGGGGTGLMGAVARSIHENNGHVTGVIPESLCTKELLYEEADELIVTKDLRERKKIMEERSDIIAVLPGGYGTLEEVMEVITLRQLHLIEKHIVFINITGFFDGLLEYFSGITSKGFAHDSAQLYSVVTTVEEAIKLIIV